MQNSQSIGEHLNLLSGWPASEITSQYNGKGCSHYAIFKVVKKKLVCMLKRSTMYSLKTISAGVVTAVVCLFTVYGLYSSCCSMTAKLDKYVQIYVDQGLFSGAVLVAKDGKILLSKGYGMANYEHMVPNTIQTKFDIGSITKQFTSMAIMQLVKEGKLKLNDTVASILPDAPHAKEITVYQLLTHTSGIPDHEESIELDYTKPAVVTTRTSFDYSKPVTTADIIEWVKDKPLDFVPASKFKYSNTGYVVLAAIIEKVSGQTYEVFLQEHIFKPLGICNTGVLHNTPLIMNRAQGYHRNGTDLQNAHYYDPSVDIGSGALFSTIGDLYLWDRALYTDKLISSDLREQLWRPCLNDYGLGWHIMSICGRRCVFHTGGWFDCATVVLRFVDDDVCIIVLSNFDSVSSPVKRIADDLAAIVFGQHYELPRTAIKIDTSLYDAYVGHYKLKLKPDLLVAIRKNKDRLFVEVAGQTADELFPESETEFFNNDVPLRISFIKDASGKVTRLLGHQGGQDFVAEKIK